MTRTLLIVLLILLASCNASEDHSQDLRAYTAAEAGRKALLYWFDSPGVYSDLHLFFKQNQEEIEKTLEVVEVAELDSRAVIFMRYSVGSSVYREVAWVRKIGEVWVQTHDRIFYSKHSYDENDPGDVLARRASEWEDNSARKWEN